MAKSGAQLWSVDTVGIAELKAGDHARAVIVTAAGPGMRAILHELALPTFRPFAARWGYDLRAAELSLDGTGADAPAQRAKWAKVGLMRAALQEYPFALWLDADVLLARDDEDIIDHLHADHFQALAIEHVPREHRVNPNSGVWLMRSCPQAFGFLDAVEAAGPQPGPWADQGSILKVLGWDRGDEQYHWARPGRGNAYLAATSWLPPGWNQPYLHGRTSESCYNGAADSYDGRPTVPNPHAIHFMGMTPTARHQHMSMVASSLKAGRGAGPARHTPCAADAR